MNSTVTRRSLLLDLRESGNSAAWQTFVTIYGPMIHGFCSRRGLQDADAADVTQEVLKAVARTMPRFEYQPERGRFRTWLLTVVRSKLNNFFHQRNSRPAAGGTSMMLHIEELPAPADENDWERDYQRHLFQWAARQVQKEVQPATWQAFWLTAVEARTAQEAAVKTGLSPGAVYVARSRVVARLRERVSSIDDDPTAFHLKDM